MTPHKQPDPFEDVSAALAKHDEALRSAAFWASVVKSLARDEGRAERNNYRPDGPASEVKSDGNA